MSSKEAKSALKLARESIRNKDFKEALKQCKSVLAEDTNNYNALVFIGVAAEGMEQYDQALKAYHRAAEVSPNELLAWQGLSTMYCKNPALIPKEEMIGIYEKLLELYANEKEKKKDVITKLIALVGDDVEKTIGLYEKLIQDSAETKGAILLQLIAYLSQQTQLKPSHEAKLVSCLEELFSLSALLSDGAGDNMETHVQKYLRLIRKRNPEMLFAECSKLIAKFSAFLYPLETKLGLLLDRQMMNTKVQEIEEIQNLLSSVSRLSDCSGVAFLAQGFLDLQNGSLLTAKDNLQKGVENASNRFCGQFFLAKTLFKLHSNTLCIQICKQGVALLTTKNCMVSVDTTKAADVLHLLAAQSCLQQSSQDSLYEALDHLAKLSEENEESDIVGGWIYLALADQEKLEAVLEKLKDSLNTESEVLRAWVDFSNKNLTTATEKLEKCVVREPSRADYLVLLGKVLWEQRHQGALIQDKCFNTLLKAAKLDPHLSEPFLYLGHFYSELKKDQQRARKCYQKAYDLNHFEEAGAALCDMMTVLGEEEAVQSLLLSITGTAVSGSAKWAWLRLGLAQMRANDQSSAITSFLSALRADPNDRHVWECLAEAYLHRGSYTAALKAFAKVLEMYPDSTYCHYQMANIKEKIGMLTDAVDDYKVIVAKSANYVPALKGLGETYLLLTQRYLSRGMVGMATDACQQAIECVTRAATQRPDLSCLWKLIGDCCLVLHPLHSSLRICVPRCLRQTASRDNTDITEISKMELLELGTRCYGKALSILPESAPLWHDLGLSFFYLSKEKHSAEDRKLLLEKSQQALQKALSIDPGSHAHWTALGVVAASDNVKNFSLAQHCFIRSIQSDGNNAVAWTNLGALYLQHGNIKLAHESFKVAQSQDPEYVNSWIGQALIAEQVGHEEAMDLFRHTTELAIHMESCLGYSHWVISTLLDVQRLETEAFQYAIKQTGAIPAAADALIRYTEVKKEDACAFNMLGLVLEHQGLHVASLAAFTKAADLVDRTGALAEGLSTVRLNQARLLSKTAHYEDACRLFESCAQFATFADLCQWGLALYKAGRYDQSSAVYEQTLELAKSSQDRSDVYAALGMVAFKTGSKDSARNALFKGVESQNSSVLGMLALCALGLLQHDFEVAAAALQELESRVDSGDRQVDLATLSVALKVFQGEKTEAVDDVDKLIGEHSPVAGLYLLLSHLGLHFLSGVSAESSAMQAIKMSGLNNQAAVLCLALSQLQAGRHSQHVKTNNALQTAQKAFHNNPDDIAALCCLIGALHGKALIRYVTFCDRLLLSRELDLLDFALKSSVVTPSQKCWCLKQKAIVQMFLDKMHCAGETLQKLLGEFPEERELVAVLQCVLSKEQASLESLVIRDGTDFFFWQILVSALLKDKRWLEAELLLREALLKARADSTSSVKLVCLVTIAWVALQHFLDGGDDALTSVLEEAEKALEQLSLQPLALMHTFQALACMDDNHRKAKHYFASVLGAERARSNLGVEVSVSKRGVMTLLQASAKPQDQELIQSLLSDAKTAGDRPTLDFYNSICRK